MEERFSLRSRIKINFDLKKKTFHLSVPVFSTVFDLPEEIKKYVEMRKEAVFRPHKTSFEMRESDVWLTQEIAFPFISWRKNIDEFWKMSEKCKEMFSEIAFEERLRDC